MKKTKAAKLQKALNKMLSTECNPGSLEAEQHGCQCPVMDNGHGSGYMGQKGIFIMTADCPLHGYICQNILTKEEENDECADEHWGDHSE